MGMVVNATIRPLYFREKDTLPIERQAGYAQEPVCRVAENPTFTENRFSYCPACCESLYRLRYPDRELPPHTRTYVDMEEKQKIAKLLIAV
jgi:hypothetical protein